MKLKKLFSVMLALLMILGLAACGPAQGGEEGGEAVIGDDMQAGLVIQGATSDGSVSGRTDLNMAVQTVNSNSTPAITSTVVGKYILFNAYEPLVRCNDDGTFTNLLAESYEVAADGVTWTFKLRDNAKFHNGDPVTANDIVESIKFIEFGSKYGQTLQYFDSYRAVDEKTFELKTIEPMPTTLNYLENIKVMCAKDINAYGYEKAGTSNDYIVAGTGPYYITNWTDNLIDMKAFPDYYLGEARIKTLHWDVITDMATILAALESGQVDFAPISTANVSVVEGDEGIQPLLNPSTHMSFFKFNDLDPRWSDIRLRQAVAYALNKEEILYGCYDGLGDIAEGVARAGYIFGAPEGLGYEYNPEKAKELLKEAGYENGFDAGTLWAVSNLYFAKGAQIMKEQLADVGITVELQLFDQPTFEESVYYGNAGNWALCFHGDNKTLDSSNFFDYFFSDKKSFVKQPDGTKGEVVYDHPEIVELGNKAAVCMDRAEREKLYNDMWKAADDECRVLCMFHRYNVWGANELLNLKLGVTYYYIYDFSWQ